MKGLGSNTTLGFGGFGCVEEYLVIPGDGNWIIGLGSTVL